MMALLLALVAASCGGGGGDGSTVASTEASAQSESGSAKEAAEAGGSQTKPSGKGSKSKGSESVESKESSSPSEPESEPSSGKGQKKVFVQQASAICSEQKKQLLIEVGEFLKENASQSNKQQALLEATRVVLVPGMEAQIAAIRRLEPPPGSAAQVDAFLAAWQHGLDTAAKSSRPMTGSYATTLLSPAGDHARKLGLSSCVYS